MASETSPKPEMEPTLAIASAAARLTVLGLDGIKSRVTDQWPVVSERVHAYFEALLQREMRAGDFFQKLDELSYLVFFHDLDATVAHAKCVSIAEVASRRLFGEDTEAVSIRVAVGRITDGIFAHDSHQILALDDALKAESFATVIQASHSVGTDDKARNQIALAVFDASQVPKFRVLFGNDLDRRYALTEQQIGFSYRPVWDSQKKVILTYICQPVPKHLTVEGAAKRFGLCFVEDAEEACLFDLLVFAEVARRIDALRKDGLRVIVACPIHYSTLSRPKSWQRYLLALNAAGAERSRDIAFLLTGVDEGIPNVRLAQEIPKLSTRSRFVFAHFKYRSGLGARFSQTGIHAIGSELASSMLDGRSVLAAIDTLALDASNAGIECFVLGVFNKSSAVGAISSGVRYLEGPAISAEVNQPRHAFVRELEDLYR